MIFGFQDVISQLDVRVFMRVPHDILKQRRHERHGYHTAGETVPQAFKIVSILTFIHLAISSFLYHLDLKHRLTIFYSRSLC